MPTRNNLGIIGPIPIEEFHPENIQRKLIRIHCKFLSTPQENSDKAPILTITQSTYDGILYNVEIIKDVLNGHLIPCI